MNEEKKYYNHKEIMRFLGIDYKFKNTKDYPFHRNIEDITFMWPTVIIPRKGIEKVIQNKISDKEDIDILKEIVMLVQIPFIHDNKVGTINTNVSLGFNYGKEYKYGDINKTLAEVCYFIERNGVKTNDFYIIQDDIVSEFMSYYVIDNQYGIGATKSVSSPNFKVDSDFNELDLVEKV
jgi:hypothetical protein